jgi:hypothetical protein
MGFLDNIERAPSTGGSKGSNRYMKFNQGENKFRIVGTVEDGGFITGMVGWGEDKEGNRKPFRWKVSEKAPQDFGDEKPKEFFAIKVYNYAEECVQILELKQRGLKDELVTYINDEEWGDPRKYDIAIIKNGEGIETRYAMTPKPHKKMTEEQREVIMKTKVDMSALYRGEDPFAGNEPVVEDDAGKEEDPF